MSQLRVPVELSRANMPEYERKEFTVAGADQTARFSDAAAGNLVKGGGQDLLWKQLGELAGTSRTAALTGYKIYEEYQSTQAREAYNEYRREAAEKQAQWSALQGKNALGPDGVQEQMRTWQEKARDRYAKNLGPVAARMFSQAAAGTDAELNAWGIRKTGQELIAYETSVDKGNIAVELDAIMADPMNFKRVGQAMGAIEQAYARIGQRNGWDEKLTQTTIQDARQNTLSQIINSQIDGENLGNARTLFSTYGEMLGDAKKPLEIRIRAKAQALEARARAEQERANAARVAAMSENVWENTKGLPWAERNEAAIEAIAAMTEDPKERRALYAAYERDAAFQKIQEDAAQGRQVRELVEYAQRENLTPSQFMVTLAKIPNEKVRAWAQKQYMGDLKENPQNREATRDLLIAIDQHSISDPEELDARIFNTGLTESQAKEVRNYLESGGKMGNLTFEQVEKVWKSVDGKLENGHMPLSVFQALEQTLKDGKKPNTRELREQLALLALSGTSPDNDSWFTISKTRNESYYTAVNNGRGNDWLPDITPEEYRMYSSEMKTLGLTFISYPMAREYKKVRLMGFRPSSNSVLKDLWNRIENGERK